MQPQAAKAYIGLGSNLGDRVAMLHRAIEGLRRVTAPESLLVSSLYETTPVDTPGEQALFLNAAAVITTRLTPSGLLDTLRRIEHEAGRRAAERHAPRVLDLDLLLFDACILRTPELTVPHPRLHRRRFVLEPLAELAPDVVHPLLGQTLRQLRDAARAAFPDQRVLRLDDRLDAARVTG